ncbi:sensor domain-containing diguanylate cyclase [Azospirillum sp. TSO35-2]|uniref:sensor domain-containing diguanylate cyclase n=1 Tax=Azospirillum sp. TSO35-2 TaxID=716796 RepID=UPI0013047DB6|nr:sensor domain-containing diguanylate cyclase [Azospirillum sp. TSO35-2]
MAVPDRTRHRRNAWLSVLVVAFVVSTASLWMFVLHNIGTYRDLDRQVAETNARMTAKAYQEYVLRTIRQIDQAAQFMRKEYVKSPGNLAESVQEISTILSSDLLFQVAVISRNGRLTFSNLQAVTESIDLSDREHFRVHLEEDRDFLFISRPLLGRVSQKWTIQFTRKIFDDRGDFIGVIVLSVDPYYFGRFSETVSLGEQDVIALLRSDRTVMSRVVGGNYDQKYLGTVIEPRPYMDPLAPDSGVYETASAIDGIKRFVGYQKIRQYGLFVVSLIDRDAAFLRSDRAVFNGVLIGVAGTLLLILASLAFGVAIWAVFNDYRTVRTMNVVLKKAHDELETVNNALKQREEELVVLSETDPLCRISNRRRFMSVSEAELVRHRRYGRIFSLFILDIDHFKSVNDTHGHSAGDAVLVGITHVIQKRLRESDTFARIGGEEFAVFLPETDVAGALVVAEDLRQSVAATTIDIGGDRCVAVTVSIGIACLDNGQSSVSDILNRADKALYAAKRDGRNRSVVDGMCTVPT